MVNQAIAQSSKPPCIGVKPVKMAGFIFYGAVD
jgi:hypothetical protein